MDDMERAGFGVGWGVALMMLTDQQLTGAWMRVDNAMRGAWKKGGTRWMYIGGTRIRTDCRPPAGARALLRPSPASCWSMHPAEAFPCSTFLSCRGSSTSTRGASSTATSNQTTCVHVGEREREGATPGGGLVGAAGLLSVLERSGCKALLPSPP